MGKFFNFDNLDCKTEAAAARVATIDARDEMAGLKQFKKETEIYFKQLEKDVDRKTDHFKVEADKKIAEIEKTSAETLVEVKEVAADTIAETQELAKEAADSATSTANDVAELKTAISELPDGQAVSAKVGEHTVQLKKAASCEAVLSGNIDLDIADIQGNVIARFSNGHIKTKNFDSSQFATKGIKPYLGERFDLKERTFDYRLMYRINTSLCTHLREKNNHQACAVYGDYFVRTHLYGGISIWKVSDGSYVSDFMLPLSQADSDACHAANCSFGVEFPSGNNQFPAFYLSETTGQKRCFVFSLTTSGATLLQTLKFDGTWGVGNDYRDFIVDRDNGNMWIVGYYDYSNYERDYGIIKRVPLPSISSGNVVFNDEDVVESFTIDEIKIIQGCCIKNNHLFVGEGYSPRPVGIHNIDLISHKRVGWVDMSFLANEMEGIAVYNEGLLCDITNVYNLKFY